MITIGIDPGSSGGIAIIWADGRAQAFAMPYDHGDYDEAALRSMMDMEGEQAFAVLEKVHAMPKQGVSSSFTFGAGWGLIRGLLSGLQVPYMLVTPQAWQKVMLAGEEHKDRKERKDSAVRVARRLFPDVSLLPTPKCKKASDGMAEALLIAEFGRRMKAGG